MPRPPYSRTINQNLQWEWLSRILMLLAVVVVVFGFLAATGKVSLNFLNLSPAASPTPVSCCRLPAYETVDKNGLGISEGGYAFDTNRSDGALKQRAALAFQKGEHTDAQSLWDQAITSDTSDAEAEIYKEDQRVLASHRPYITLVVATMLTGGDSPVNAGRDNLQGAYIIQKTYNDGSFLPGGEQIRLLVANSGGNAQDANKIATQIVSAAHADKTILGVMGWPFSGQTQSAVNTLTEAHIPMVSPTASSGALTNISPFFFRVCPPNQNQAIAGADYAAQRLNAINVALFVDSKNSYSKSLADGFRQQFMQDGGQIVDTEQYTVGNKTNLPDLLQNALKSNPDLIYFSGYAADMGVLLTDLQSSNPNLEIMGGDALYQIGAYPGSAHANYHRLRFTTFAFPDEWDVLGYPRPAFFDTYARTYDPNNQHPNSPYGYSRPDSDVILSYDAMASLLEASKRLLTNGNSHPTPETLQQSLRTLTPDRSIQGISGQIAFGNDGNPVNKAMVILSVDSQGYTQLTKNDVLGCFLQNQCS